MTALQANLQAYGHYATSRRLGATQEAVTTTGSDLRLMEHQESPSAFVEREVYVEGEAYSLDAFEMFWASHEAAGSVSWTASTPFPDDAPISSPFQTIDERRSEAEKVFELIGLIRRLGDLPFARRLARRLEDLVRIAQ